MKQRPVAWIVGTILTMSLIAAPPANAAKKGVKGGISAAKRYRVTQITDRDVVLLQGTRIQIGRLILHPFLENGRQALAPNPDAQRQMLTPNPDAQRQVLAPNPSTE
jgi:hypothetical protein